MVLVFWCPQATIRLVYLLSTMFMYSIEYSKFYMGDVGYIHCKQNSSSKGNPKVCMQDQLECWYGNICGNGNSFQFKRMHMLCRATFDRDRCSDGILAMGSENKRQQKSFELNSHDTFSTTKCNWLELICGIVHAHLEHTQTAGYVTPAAPHTNRRDMELHCYQKSSNICRMKK